MVRAWNLDFVAAGINELDTWPNDFGSTPAFRVNHHQRGQACDFIHLASYGHAFFDVFKSYLAGKLGNDGPCQGIPIGQNRTGLDALICLDGQDRTIGNLVTLSLTPMFVMNHDFA